MTGKDDEFAMWDDVDWGEASVETSAPVDMQSTSPPVASAAIPEPGTPPEVPVSPARQPPPLPSSCRPTESSGPPPKEGGGSVGTPPASQGTPAVCTGNQPRTSSRPKTGSLEPAVRDAGPIVHAPSTVATLTLASSDGQERICTLERTFSVGRKPDNDLVILDRQVSGYHARLFVDGAGRFEIEDLHSSGGTYVNGEEVTRHSLSHGDRIEFASVVAYFHYIAGSHVEPADEFEETFVFRRAKPTQAMTMEPSVRRCVGMLSFPLADGGRSLQPISQSKVTIGRSEDNDLVIFDPHVSGHHATIGLNEDGEYEVEDLNSTCGTLVNGLSIIRCPLNPGDRLTFGSVDCLFEMVES